MLSKRVAWSQTMSTGIYPLLKDGQKNQDSADRSPAGPPHLSHQDVPAPNLAPGPANDRHLPWGHIHVVQPRQGWGVVG